MYMYVPKSCSYVILHSNLWVLEWALNKVQKLHLGQDEVLLPKYVEMVGEDVMKVKYTIGFSIRNWLSCIG